MLARLPSVRIIVFDLLPSTLITPIRVGWGPEYESCVLTVSLMDVSVTDFRQS